MSTTEKSLASGTSGGVSIADRRGKKMSIRSKLSPRRLVSSVLPRWLKIQDELPEYDEVIVGELNLFTEEEIESDKYRFFDPDLSPERVTEIQNETKELRRLHRTPTPSKKHGNR